jgi:hypothetical protein
MKVIAMRSTAQRIAETVHANGARVLCFPCLAARQGLAEHDVRAAALPLIARAGLTLAHRLCASCGRVAETLVQRTAA